MFLFIKSVYRHLRRLFYLKCRKAYIEESIKLRKGGCKHCGCCKRVFKQCSYFKNGKDCAKYPNFPQVCKIYPFDEKDKNEFSRKFCGFYWEG